MCEIKRQSNLLELHYDYVNSIYMQLPTNKLNFQRLAHHRVTPGDMTAQQIIRSDDEKKCEILT
jgi:hypothetical protein